MVVLSTDCLFFTPASTNEYQCTPMSTLQQTDTIIITLRSICIVVQYDVSIIWMCELHSNRFLSLYPNKGTKVPMGNSMPDRKFLFGNGSTKHHNGCISCIGYRTTATLKVIAKMQPASRTQPSAVIGWHVSRDKLGHSWLHFSRNVLFCLQPVMCRAYCVVAAITNLQPAQNDTMPVFWFSPMCNHAISYLLYSVLQILQYSQN